MFVSQWCWFSVCLSLLVEGNSAGQHTEGGSERRKDWRFGRESKYVCITHCIHCLTSQPFNPTNPSTDMDRGWPRSQEPGNEVWLGLVYVTSCLSDLLQTSPWLQDKKRKPNLIYKLKHLQEVNSKSKASKPIFGLRIAPFSEFRSPKRNHKKIVPMFSLLNKDFNHLLQHVAFSAADLTLWHLFTSGGIYGRAASRTRICVCCVLWKRS